MNWLYKNTIADYKLWWYTNCTVLLTKQIIMKTILAVAAVAGIAGAIAIYFFSEANKTAGDEIADAAGNAYDTMNKHIGSVERATERAFGS